MEHFRRLGFAEEVRALACCGFRPTWPLLCVCKQSSLSSVVPASAKRSTGRHLGGLDAQAATACRRSLLSGAAPPRGSAARISVHYGAAAVLSPRWAGRGRYRVPAGWPALHLPKRLSVCADGPRSTCASNCAGSSRQTACSATSWAGNVRDLPAPRVLPGGARERRGMTSLQPERRAFMPAVDGRGEFASTRSCALASGAIRLRGRAKAMFHARVGAAPPLTCCRGTGPPGIACWRRSSIKTRLHRWRCAHLSPHRGLGYNARGRRLR